MTKTRIVLREHFCENCNRNVVQKIEIPLGLNHDGGYTNNYCLKCDARLRENDFKEVRTDFDCPVCSSFLNSGFVKVCAGCGESMSWVALDNRMFNLPKHDFKRNLLIFLESAIDIEEPKKKHEVEIKQYVCPFCEHKETIKVNEQIWNEKTKGWETTGIDYWECSECGEENDIGLENFEKYFKIFMGYTEKNDWGGLRNFCIINKFDDFMLFSLAKYYIQKQEFEKSLNIAKILIEIDPADICSEELMEKSEKGMRFVNKNG